MNQSKFSWADAITVIVALIFGYFCFLSVNFHSLGETSWSIFRACIFALVVGGLAFGAKLLKMTSRNLKRALSGSGYYCYCFVVMAAVFTVPFSHYFVVTAEKDGIQQKLKTNLTQAEGMFTNYEKYANNRLDIYKSRLNSVVSAKSVNLSEYRDYGFVDGRDDSEQVKNKMFSLKAKLFPSNYSQNEVKRFHLVSIFKSDYRKLEFDRKLECDRNCQCSN